MQVNFPIAEEMTFSETELGMFDKMVRNAHKVVARVENGLPRLSLQLGGRQYLVPPAVCAGVDRWRETWKSRLIRKLLASCEDPVFVDVGANVGQTLLDFLAAGTGGNYFGFEPSPACAAQVQRIIDLNDIPKAFVFPFCIHEQSDVLTFYRNRHSDTDESATTVAGLRPSDTVSQVFVPAFPLDYVAEKFGWPNIDAVKIDVEGAEVAVLLGMKNILQNHRPVIVSEVLRADADADMADYATSKSQLRDVLSHAGYSIYSIIQDGGRNFNRIEKCDAFPIEVWTEHNAHACDYLFVPQERDVQPLAA